MVFPSDYPIFEAELKNYLMNFKCIYTICRLYLLVFTVAVFACSHTVKGQNLSYQEFERIPLNDMLSVICFVQDPLGVMWMGTNRGLYSYDGYTVRKNVPPKGFIRDINTIYCGVLFDEERIWFGASAGGFIYNYKHDCYEAPPVKTTANIRCMYKWKGILWIGSFQGLYKYHIAERKLEKVNNPAIPHQVVYSIAGTEEGILYIGTHDGLCTYNPALDEFKEVQLSTGSGKGNLPIHSLYYDPLRHCVWVGTAKALYKCDASRQVQRIALLDGTVIKSITADYDKNLLLGADNGLYIYNPETASFRHIVHDSRYPQSLVDNIIMNIFVDHRKNIWIGTNLGGAIYHHDKAYQFIPISQITGIGDGNYFIKAYKDLQQNLWLGGTEGLIMVPGSFNDTLEKSFWYRVGDPQFPLRNNLVRDIYEDREHHIWLATEGGIGRIDPATKQVIYYTITDNTQQFNANWANSIAEDDEGRLWIAAWLGGIFVVDKTALMKSATSSYTADYHFSKRNGLTNNDVYKLVKDPYGHIWSICDSLCKIGTETFRVEKVTLYDDQHEELLPYFKHMLCDKEGYMWVAVYNGVCRVNPRTNEVTHFRFENLEENGINSIVEVDNQIWVSSSDAMIIVEKRSLKVGYFGFPNKKFSGSFYDESSDRAIFGGIDGITIFSKNLATKDTHNSPFYLTGLHVNGKPFEPLAESIRYLQTIELNYTQNNLTFEFSDLLYSLQSRKVMYRMEGLEREWQMVRLGSNHITYTNLPPGEYELCIASLDAQGSLSKNRSRFTLVIQPPWYYSGLAKCIYMIVLLGLVLWTINYFRVRNRLRIERIEKEKTLELSRLKIDFFTDISHEFKTPLSLIIAPVSKLILEAKNPQLKTKLKMIEQNALHLSTLINRALNFQRVDESEQTVIRSTVDVVEFFRNIFNSYATLCVDKQIDARFVSSIDTLYVPIDILKMESVLNNLLSNALKYTEAGGFITCSVQHDEAEGLLEMSVSDSGIGIAPEEVSYVFDRFFQSKNAKGKEGAGIGLYLVKSYVELHGGTVSVHSSEGEGTRFCVQLPVEAELRASKEVSVDASDDMDNPLVLIVEDNNQIVEFISESLDKEYRVVVAYDGKSGLELCNKMIPDLIIADVMMPVMDGLEMCRCIRKQPLFTSTPIIMLTAKDDAGTERKSVDIGVEYFIPKPFDIAVLMSRIRQLTGTRKKLEEKIRIKTLAEPSRMEVVSVNERFLEKITKIIEDKVPDPDFNVNALVEISGTDAKQLYRKLKQLTGKSPVEYIKTIRLKKAAMLLSEKKFSVSEVMYLVGFSNHSYFTRSFQKEFGKTPKQFVEEA